MGGGGGLNRGEGSNGWIKYRARGVSWEPAFELSNLSRESRLKGYGTSYN